MHALEFDCRYQYRSGFQLDVAFQLPSGVSALTGPSGSGKSTVLELIAGVRRPDAGRIQVLDEVFFDSQAGICTPPDLRRVGIVFQDYLLFPHLTVASNLRYALARRRAGRITMEQVVELLELEPLLGRYPAALSGGQRQRTALGRALLSDPRLLALDEPLNAQDPDARYRIVDYLVSAARELSIPVLLVSHDLELVDGIPGPRLRLARGKLLS